jgi:hypothetical protein
MLSRCRATYGSLTQLLAGLGYGLVTVGVTGSRGVKFNALGVRTRSSTSSSSLSSSSGSALVDGASLEPAGEEGSGTFLAETDPAPPPNPFEFEFECEFLSLSVVSNKLPMEVESPDRVDPIDLNAFSNSLPASLGV